MGKDDTLWLCNGPTVHIQGDLQSHVQGDLQSYDGKKNSQEDA